MTRPTTILVVQYLFPPLRGAEAPVTAKTVRHLAGRGYRLTILCGDAATSIDGVDRSLEGYVKHANVRIITVPSFESARIWRVLDHVAPDFLRLPDPKRLWIGRALAVARQLLDHESFDLVYSRSQYNSSHLVGLALKEVYRLPWLTHFSDPWADNPYRRYRWAWARSWNDTQEKAVIERADAVTVASPRMLAMLQRRYPRASSKMSALVHSYSPELYPHHSGAKPAGAPVVAAYLGGFYGPRSPEPLLQALEILQRQDPHILTGVTFRLIGRMDPAIRQAVEKSPMSSHVRIEPSVDYLESLKIACELDILLLIDAAAAESVFLPSKLIDYLGAERYIFAITPESGSAADLMRQLGGQLADPSRPAEIAERLRSTLHQAKLGQLPPLDGSVRESYSQDAVHRPLVTLINRLVGR